MTVVADGAHWNPGGGPGKYTYIGGVWVKQVSKADTDALYLTAAQADVLFLTQTEGDARYVLLSTPPVSAVAFSAHKNGTPQTVPTGTPTLITWSTTAYDVGGHFASSLWTPPAGKVYLTSSAICTPLPPITYSFTGANFQFWGLLKNGSLLKQTASYEQANSNGAVLSVTAEDVANGTDTYGVQATFTLTGASAQV